ncbi:hypothetical protein FQN57_001695 [Myotisia sp. PD_48]|nr:hypothetical protein FQN57_001695 [Myotisia sp. PD_48]
MFDLILEITPAYIRAEPLGSPYVVPDDRPWLHYLNRRGQPWISNFEAEVFKHLQAQNITMVRLAAAFGVVATLLATGVLAHPGGDHAASKAQLRNRALELEEDARLLSACLEKHKRNGLHKKNIERRAATMASIRKARGIDTNMPILKRSYTEGDHSHTSVTSTEEMFGNSNAACILASDAMIGPYFVDGELIRQDITNNEQGIKMDVDLQIIDVATCNPVPNMYVDFWQSNSTGIYSGVVAQGNGNARDQRNWNTTMGRAVYPSDAKGIVHFTTLFPGHYTGRTIHIHVLTHEGGSRLPNNTFKGGYASHIGQIYFDQNLIYQVERNPPYNTNRQPLTTNGQDFILQQQLRQSRWSPLMEYSLVGTDIRQGLLSWITLAINRNRRFAVTPAAYWTEKGGVPARRIAGNGPRSEEEVEEAEEAV